jgi:hypothetical protein
MSNCRARLPEKVGTEKERESGVWKAANLVEREVSWIKWWFHWGTRGTGFPLSDRQDNLPAVRHLPGTLLKCLTGNSQKSDQVVTGVFPTDGRARRQWGGNREPGVRRRQEIRIQITECKIGEHRRGLGEGRNGVAGGRATGQNPSSFSPSFVGRPVV